MEASSVITANAKSNQTLQLAVDEYLSKLNESQRAAACFERKNLLMLAGAGTGKTRTMIASELASLAGFG